MSTALITADTCSQDIGSITGITVTGTPSFTFTWYQASGGTVATTKDLSSIGAGSYYLVVADQNNCSTTGQSVNVDNLTPQMNAPVYDDIVVLKGHSAALTPKAWMKGLTTFMRRTPVTGRPLSSQMQKAILPPRRWRRIPLYM
ncbi:MAG TPA: hypothetical protein VGS79_00430 [Puia sp.]|nr:hypothetical protein [Puia sp.]